MQGQSKEIRGAISMPIWPNVEIWEKDVVMINGAQVTYFYYHTTIRKRHRGKYYLQKILETATCHEASKKTDCRDYLLKRFLRSVYNALVLGKVDPNLVLPAGAGHSLPLVAFQLDPDQRSEEDRLRDILNKC